MGVRGGHAAQAAQDRAGALGVGVAGGDGLGDAPGAVEDVTGLEPADLPFGNGEFAQPLKLESNAAFGEGQVTVGASQGGEQGGLRGGVGEGFEFSERLSVQRLDALGDELGNGVGRGVGLGQSVDFQGRRVRTALARDAAGADGAVAAILGLTPARDTATWFGGGMVRNSSSSAAV